MTPFIRHVRVVEERIENADAFPFTLPSVKQLDGVELGPVTYLVGENGSGKSTILEAIAVAAGYNAEGGTKNFRFSTRSSESPLHRAIRLSRSARRERTGFFLRAESFFDLATEIEQRDAEGGFGPPIIASYGGKSLHEQSHGESFLSLVKHRFGPDGLYILDEPEAALSPSRQLALLRRVHDLVEDGSQFIVATHAPIVMAYPGATIYYLDGRGITKVAYEETELLINHLEKMKRAKADSARPAPAKLTKNISRHATRTMFETHGDQCCFVDERTGARCPSPAFIQRDHVHMQAHGGGHDSANLRPLCAAHNRYLAELAFGREYVERCIDYRQRKQLGPKTPTGA